MRNLTPGIHASLNSCLTRPVMFVEVMSTPPIYAHTSIGQISANGHVWIGCGEMGSIGEIQDSAEIQAANLSISLSGIPISQLKQMMESDLQGSEINIYIGVLDENMKLDGGISLLWTGFVDTAPFTYGKTIKTTLHCESEMVDWGRPRLRRYTDQDQQALYPGDKGFEFTPLMESISIHWGSS